MISDTRALYLGDVADYYHDYYNDFNNSLGSINKYNITNQYDYQELMETNNLDIIAYNNSLVSFKGIKPSRYKKRDIKNKKEVFEYDANLEDLALNLDSGYLAYEFGLGQSGTILMEFKAFLLKEKRILLKNKFGTFDVSIYIKSDRYVYLNFNGTEYNTNLRILHEQWNKISFGYSLVIVSSSLSVYTFSFRIVLNGVEYVTVLEANKYISYTNVKTYIGSDESEEYSLDGLVSKVAFTDKYLNKDNIVSIFTSLVPIKAISKYDDFNRILNKKVLDNYEHYSIMYSYEVNDSKKYTRVSSEFINHARYYYPSCAETKIPFPWTSISRSSLMASVTVFILLYDSIRTLTPLTVTSPSARIKIYLTPSIILVSTRSPRSERICTEASGVLTCKRFPPIKLAGESWASFPKVSSYCSSKARIRFSETPQQRSMSPASSFPRRKGSSVPSSLCSSRS